MRKHVCSGKISCQQVKHGGVEIVNGDAVHFRTIANFIKLPKARVLRGCVRACPRNLFPWEAAPWMIEATHRHHRYAHTPPFSRHCRLVGCLTRHG